MSQESRVELVFRESPKRAKGQHCCVDAVVLACVDPGFRPVVKKFLAERNLTYDPLWFPSGARVLTSAVPSSRFVFADAVKLLISAHRAKKVILVIHTDCAAAPIQERRQGDERRNCLAALKSAHNCLLSTLGRDVAARVEMEMYLHDFEGLWRVRFDA